MTQAYQPPQPATSKALPRLPIQSPSPKHLIHRAVERVRLNQTRSPQIQGMQPQMLPPQPSRRVSTAPQRIKIDWKARLAEARQRLAERAAAERAAKLQRLPSPPRPEQIARAGSMVGRTMVQPPLVKPSPVSRQSKFSRSVRRRKINSPVVRTGQAAARLRVPERLNDYYRWPQNGFTTTVERRVAPRSGSQLYAQRLNALREGQIYTRMPVDSFYEQWRRASGHPSYWQWRKLLAMEARAVGRGKGQNNLTVMVGDSLSQWFPADHLPGEQIWLNQSISGDTTEGILKRLAFLRNAKPDTIYFMAGVNDVKRGASNREILRNIHQILSRLRQHHPQAQIVVQSILPTRSNRIPNGRIAQINPLIQQLAQRHGVEYLDLHQQFRDWDGGMRSDLTTDGIHLSPRGYQVWQAALQRMNQRLAQRPRTIAQAQALRENI